MASVGGSAAAATERSLARSTAWNVAGGVAPLLVAVAAVPPTLRALGTDRFGALALAWTFVGYFSLFDLGLGRALTRLVAERAHLEHDRELPVLVWTALALTLALGGAAALAVVLGAPWLVGRVLRVPAPLQPETLAAFRLLGASMPFVIGTAGLRGVLEARQAFGAVNAIRVPMAVLTFLAPLLVLPFSRSLVPIVALLAAGRVAGWAVHLWVCLRLAPELRQVGLSARPLRPLLRLGGWMTVTNVVGPVMVYLDRFYIGAAVSLAAVAYYATPFELTSKLLVVPTAVAQVLFPAFATALARDRDRARALYLRGVWLVFALLLPPTLLLAAFAPGILRLWLGADFAAAGAPVLRWLAAGTLLNSLAQVPFAFVQGAGHPDRTGRLHLLELPAYVAALWWLVGRFGVTGAAMAWTLRVGLDAVLLFAMAGRLLGDERAPATDGVWPSLRRSAQGGS